MNSYVPYGDLKGGRLMLAAFVLALANFMVVLDMTIANVSVPHITGKPCSIEFARDMGHTSYAVAEAICVPLTGWLAGRFGGVRVFTLSLIRLHHIFGTVWFIDHFKNVGFLPNWSRFIWWPDHAAPVRCY